MKPTTETPFQSWKEIGAYLQRDATTARRWEKEEGLPVHRHSHKARASVYAYPSEIDAWRESRRVLPEAPPPRPLWKRPAFALTMALCLVMVGNGLRPQKVEAQGSGIATKQVWIGGPEMDISGTVSRDGRFLPYRDPQTADLMLRDLATGQARGLKLQESSGFPVEPVISPDGKQVVYSWYPRGLRVAAVGGDSAPRALVTSPDIEWIGPSDWSPDSKWISVRVRRRDRTGQIGLVSATDGSLRVLKSMDWDVPGKVLFSPDGKYIAFDQRAVKNSSERDIFIMAADGSREVAAVVHPAFDTVVAWAPDGRSLLFWSNRTGRPDLWSIPIREGRPQGTPQLVKSDAGDLRPMGMTQDGVLYFGFGPWGGDLILASIDFKSGKVTTPPISAVDEFVGTNGQPDWSPDGKYLAYRSVRSDSSDKNLLVIRSMETGQTRELQPKLERFNMARWSPDGTAFIAQGTDDRGKQGAYRIDVESGRTDVIAEGAARPQWTAEARRILYLAAGDAGSTPVVRERDLSSGLERTLPLPGLVATPFVRISPDGRYLAYVASESATKQQTLRVFPMDGGDSRALQQLSQGETISADSIAWTADSASVLFMKAQPAGSKQELWQVPRTGGQARKVELNVENARSLAVHPDGRRVVFSAVPGNREVWKMENFLPAVVK